MSLKPQEVKPLPEAEPGKPLLAKPRREVKEVDLRGLTVAEALLEVDQALEEARALGLSTLRLLHGKGTGALRQAIREALRRDKRVESFADAPPGEGGMGLPWWRFGLEGLDHLLRLVRQAEELEVLRPHGLLVPEEGEPADEPFPVAPVQKEDGEAVDLLRLEQDQDLGELVQGAEPPGRKTKPTA